MMFQQKYAYCLAVNAEISYYDEKNLYMERREDKVMNFFVGKYFVIWPLRLRIIEGRVEGIISFTLLYASYIYSVFITSLDSIITFQIAYLINSVHFPPIFQGHSQNVLCAYWLNQTSICTYIQATKWFH